MLPMPITCVKPEPTMPERYRTKLDALVNGALDAGDFGHLDHLGVAYEALCRHPFPQAFQTVAAGLASLTKRAGEPEKYNATITFAYLSLIGERMHERHWPDAAAFLAGNADLAAPGLIEKHYTPARLASPTARQISLLPDRAGP